MPTQDRTEGNFDTIKEMMELFKGSSLTFGQWNPKSGEMHTEKNQYTKLNFEDHVKGRCGMGVVPVLDGGYCKWGAIDIDCHSSGKEINLISVANTIFSKGLPLVPCRSKSGGVHCYLFTSQRVPTSLMVRLLKELAQSIGYAGSEIFPKQLEITKDSNTGNWINLPYFGGENTNRYAVEIRNGEPIKLTTTNFVKYSNSMKLTDAMMKLFLIGEHNEAPPCLQSLLVNGIPKGVRNEVLYAFTVYLKKRFTPAACKSAAIAVNQKFEPPVQLSEAIKTITSAMRPQYRYKCMSEPFRSLCDSKLCVTMKYGIEPSDTFATKSGMPDFSGLKVMSTEPPIWEITVNNVPINVPTRVLRDYSLLSEELMERLLIITPPIAPKDWMSILSGLMENVGFIEAPDNASMGGVIRGRLCEFIGRADFDSDGKNLESRLLLERGLPVVIADGNGGHRFIAFRGNDFISYLKRSRSEELKGIDLWMALKKMGIDHKRQRVGTRVLNTWTIPIDGKGRTKLDYDYDEKSVFTPSFEKKVVNIANRLNF